MNEQMNNQNSKRTNETPAPAKGRELTEEELRAVSGGSGGRRMSCGNNLKQIGVAIH